MSPLEATVALMQNWAVTGLLKNQTPEQLRGEAVSLYLGLQGATMAPKTRRKAKTPTEGMEPAKPTLSTHVTSGATGLSIDAQAPVAREADPW